MIDCKTTLLVVGIVVALMGLLGMLPVFGMATLFGSSEPIWYSVLKVLIGLIAIWVSQTQK